VSRTRQASLKGNLFYDAMNALSSVVGAMAVVTRRLHVLTAGQPVTSGCFANPFRSLSWGATGAEISQHHEESETIQNHDNG
jgi:hypothetical protein